MRYLRDAVIALLVLGGSSAMAGEQPIVTTDLLRIRSVGVIDVSKDASTAVFTVRSIVEVSPHDDELPGSSISPGDASVTTYQRHSHLFALDLFDVDARPRQLTFGHRYDTSPAISPDGRQVAFVRGDESDPDDESGSAQIWVIDLGGGEARQVTNLDHGAAGPQWAPDARRLLVQSSLPRSALLGAPPWPMERPMRDWDDAAATGAEPRPDGSRAEIRAWLARNAIGHDPFVINRIGFQGEHELRRELRFAHLFLIDTRDTAADPRQLTDGFYHHSGARFVGPEGRRIVYVTGKPALEHLDRARQGNLWMINADGSDDRQLLSLEGWSLGAPRPSQDGALLALSGERMDEPAYRLQRLGLASLDGDAEPVVEWLTGPESFDGDAADVRWLPARSSLLFRTWRQGGVPLMTISMGLLEPVPVIDEMDGLPVGVQRYGVGGGTIVYSLTSADNPCRLWVADARGDRMVMDLNEWVADKRLSRPRGDWIDRPDGQRVQWWLMEPTNRVEGKQYPLALEMHGGPSAMWGPGEFTMWLEFQLLCSWGYGVAYANPRGSGGYGYDFKRGNYQDWGDGPTGDVLAALDQACLEEWVDSDRLVLTGGSYAGYLTAWIVGHDSRFKAAVAQRGVYDLQTFFGEGNAWRLVPWAMGGYPWQARIRGILQRESPFTYVNRIKTPLLIMHASEDLRTGVSQSEMLYRALKELNRPVEYVRYPGAGHDLSRTGDPRQRLDRLNRIIEFFERFVDNDRPAPRTQ